MIEPDDLLDPALYQATRRPLGQAETLPAWCYRDDSFYRRELERVFAPAWRFVGRVDELPAAGDYRAVWTVPGPVIVVRGQDGELRAFANSCRHRGAALVDGQGRCRRFLCPYHGWSYDLSGRLIAAPGMEEAQGFDRVTQGLIPVRLALWAGFVFVNPSPQAPPLDAALGNLPAMFASHDLPALRCLRRVSFQIEANWKLLVENALEAYHTGSVHGATLGQQTAEPLAAEGDWTGLLVVDRRSVATLRQDDPRLPPVAGLSAAARRGTFFTMIYPSTQLAFAQDCVWWLDFQPLGATRTRLELGSCFPETSIGLAAFEEAVESYYRRWELATPEDNEICEIQQRGLASRLRPPGRFAADEFAVHAFDNWLLDRTL